MQICVFFFGALTSKPYAFVARSWELESVESVDFYDALGSSIKIDFRGNSIMRILPKVNELVNEEWISDLIRFSYDGFKKQRLDIPLSKFGGVKNQNLIGIDADTLVPVSWQGVFTFLDFFSFKFRNSSPFYFCYGKFVDLETFLWIKFLNNNLYNLNFYSHVSHSVFSMQEVKFLIDFREYYLTKNLRLFLNSELFLFLGINLRLDLPVLNLRVRKQILNKKLKVFAFGSSYMFNFDYIDLGKNSNILFSIVEGKHKFCQMLLQCKSSIVCFGSGFYRRKDSIGLQNLLLIYFARQSKVLMLPIFTSLINAAELGLVSFYDSNLVSDGGLLWVFDNDEVDFSRKFFNLVIYQGHHGDNFVKKADIVLPGCLPFEKFSTFVFLDGRYERLRFVLAPPGNVKVDWKILAAFYFFFKKGDNFVTLNELFSVEIGGNRFKFFNDIFLTVSSFVFGNLSINNCLFVSSVYNYYLSNSVCKASTIMALSSQRFFKTFVNYKL